MTHTTDLTCQQDGQRRKDVRKHPQYNGLDYLEIVDDSLVTGKPVQLRVYFLDKAPAELRIENIQISGGQRITDLRVIHMAFCRDEDPDVDDCMILTLNHPGDLSTYRLCIVEVDADGRPTGRLHPAFDRHYACLDFSFRSVCPSDLDCAAAPACEPPLLQDPEINYLAKDYASFRQLILDRLAVVMPDWTERLIPDLGITLVELLAYTGDYISYYQDAVATEAYLETARRRVSVRRHVRLVDYFLHEGCNARAWLCARTSQDTTLEPEEIFFITGYQENDPPGSAMLTARQLASIPRHQYEIFEPLAAAEHWKLYAAHNEILFYTWGQAECCLPAGSTTATLLDGWQTPNQQQYGTQAAQTQQERLLRNLSAGDVLIFQERIGPETGSPADADPNHRHAVRLARVEPGFDSLYGTPIVEIEWLPEDALPFALCLSARPVPPECVPLENISVACGNVILIDHGGRVEEPLGCVPLKETREECEADCAPVESQAVAGKFRPALQQNRAASPGELTHAQPVPTGRPPASALLRQDPRLALPWIALESRLDPDCPPAPPPGALDPQTPAIRWSPRRDLLAAASTDPYFVVEIENDRRAWLRFGDGQLGMRPPARSRFTARYRLGNGAQGNVGAGAIRHIVFRRDLLSGLTLAIGNPMPARGGIDPEPLEEARQFAPFAFRQQKARAITAEDYAEIVMRDFANEVQRAAAALRWMGSWYSVLVAVDPRGSSPASADLLARITAHLEDYRRIGHALTVGPAQYVPLSLALDVCVKPGYLRAHVKAALLTALGSARGGFFHPDQLTFGEGITLSQVVTAAQSVTGVESVIVRAFQRMFEAPNQEIENGFLPLAPLEIARLENNPNQPENGILTLTLAGGR